MRDYLEFFLTCLALSLVLTYALWVRYRVWVFRQDLFKIRDELWDEMLKLGNLDLTEHREFRDGINSLIRIAPLLSIFTMVRLLGELKPLHEILSRRGYPPAIHNARRGMVLRTARFLLLETISGWLFLAFLIVPLGLRGAMTYMAAQVTTLFDAHAFQELDRRTPRKIREQLTSP